MNPLVIAGAVGVAALALAKGKKSSSKPSGMGISPQATLANPNAAMKALNLAQEDWPAMTFSIPFAGGNATPRWPVNSSNSKAAVVSYKTVAGSYIGNSSRRFMSPRGSGRYHVGVDLYCNNGDVVVAAESGKIVNIYHFYHGSYAIFVQCDSGLVINYGEVKKNSWKEFGLGVGSKIQKGQPIAKIGVMSGGSSMLHIETYMPPTTANKKYHGGDSGPITNPTYYLLRARQLAFKGASFSGAGCAASGVLNSIPVPREFRDIELEDRELGEAPQDSVLPELLVDTQLSPQELANQRADGP